MDKFGLLHGGNRIDVQFVFNEFQTVPHPFNVADNNRPRHLVKRFINKCFYNNFSTDAGRVPHRHSQNRSFFHALLLFLQCFYSGTKNIGGTESPCFRKYLHAVQFPTHNTPHGNSRFDLLKNFDTFTR